MTETKKQTWRERIEQAIEEIKKELAKVRDETNKSMDEVTIVSDPLKDFELDLNSPI